MSYDEMVLLAETYNQTLYGDIVNKVINLFKIKLQASVNGSVKYFDKGWWSSF